MLLFSLCSHSASVTVFLILKTAFRIICILLPLIIIIRVSIPLIKTVADGGATLKKQIFPIFKSLFAALFIFFIPLLFSYIFTDLLNLGTSEIFTCFDEATTERIKILREQEKEKRIAEKKKRDEEIKKATDEKTKEWEEETARKQEQIQKEKARRSNLDFSCTSETVNSQFSCDTLKIVENHLYDLNYYNFYNQISTYGGFENYANNLGGVFAEFYGKPFTKEKATVTDFQKAAEYVVGWMYMYGWDYESGPGGEAKGDHVKWGGSNYTPDAFYANGGWKTKYKGAFDDVISGKNGLSMMASECGDLEIFTYEKLGISRETQLPKVTRLRDLKVGDGVYFGREKKWDKLDESTWKSSTGAHNVIVGEVYSDRIVFYDAGRNFQMTRNYKRTVTLPQEDSEEADDAALQKEFGDLATGWGVRRWYDFG